MAATARLARAADHDYIGTEHLLFVLAADPGSRSRRPLNDLEISFADVEKELEGVAATLAAGGGTDPRRWCSSCGRAESLLAERPRRPDLRPRVGNRSPRLRANPRRGLVAKDGDLGLAEYPRGV